MNTIQSGIEARLEILISIVDDIAYGKKPTNYPQELFTLLEQMKKQGFILEAPEAYVTLPTENANDQTLMRHKGVTNVHPISKKLLERAEKLEAETKQANIYNYKILGLDPYFRLYSENNGTELPDPVEIADDAKALIMARGDIHTLRQGLYLLRAKLNNDARTQNTTLIIQNTHNEFWSPLLSYLGLKTPRTSALENLGIYTTQFRGAGESMTSAHTVAVLKGIENMQLAPRANRLSVDAQPGDFMYVASGSAHKPMEIGQTMDEKRIRIRVASLNSRIDIKPREAEEDNFSLEGNNLQKLHETMHAIVSQGVDNVCGMLCPPGKGPENVWLVFDDRGLSFLDKRIMQTKAYAPAHSQLNPLPYKDAPGAELAPVLKTHSRVAFFEKMLPGAIDELTQDGSKLDLTVLDQACHITVRLDWMLDAATKGMPLKYIATMATRRSGVLTVPQPPTAATQTDHYLYPLTENAGVTDPAKIRTKAQIDRYISTGSEIADSMAVLSTLTGMDKHAENLKGYTLSKLFNTEVDKDKYGRPSRLNIATIYSLFPQLNGHGSKIVNAAMGENFKLISGRGTTQNYDLSEFATPTTAPMLSRARANKAHVEIIDKALTRLRDLYQDADGFIFTPDNATLSKIPGIKWLKSLFYYSLVVGKQVDDRAIKAKFVGQMTGDPSWTEQRKLFDYLARTPVLLNRYEDVMQDYKNKAELKSGLENFYTTYARPSIPEKEITRKTDGKEMPEDMYRVTIYCSASLGKDTQAVKEAREFTFGLAQEGCAIINGGGREGLMVATSEGVHAFRAIWSRKCKGKEAPRTHVTSYQCHDTYEREGGWHEKNDDAVIFQTIEQRMANLMNTDAEVLMAGGSGSIQEIMASLLMREWGLSPTRNRPFIVVNQKLDGAPVFDQLMKMISLSDRKRLNIHVVDTAEQATNIILESRAAMQKELGENAIYTPTPNPDEATSLKQEYKQPRLTA